MKHVALPSGGNARVSADVAPETLVALDELCKAAVRDVNRQIDHCAMTGEIDHRNPKARDQRQRERREPQRGVNHRHDDEHTPERFNR